LRKKLISEYGIPVPRGEITRSPEDAANIAERLGGEVVIRAQISCGGRGKDGGIKRAEFSAQMG